VNVVMFDLTYMSMHMTINFMRFLINWLSGRLCDEEPLFYMIRCIDPSHIARALYFCDFSVCSFSYVEEIHTVSK